MYTAGDLCATESATDLEAFSSGDGEHSVRQHGFEFVEDRLADTNGTVSDHARYRAADAVACVAVFLDQGGHSCGCGGGGAADGDVFVYFVPGDVVD